MEGKAGVGQEAGEQVGLVLQPGGDGGFEVVQAAEHAVAQPDRG